ncbi:MAG: beta-ketoacyl-ACP synthase II, partial [Chloroflexi bacterium]|nr:beta-ketoacyl-ACP synthase II [Chloroflexota bacterium]
AIAASVEAVKNADLRMDAVDRSRVGVVIGTGIGGLQTLSDAVMTLTTKGPDRVSPYAVPMFIPDIASGQVATLLQAYGPNFATVSACTSSAHALGEAAEIIQRDRADVMIAGGSESPIVPVSVAAFGSLRALSRRNDSPETASRPFDSSRDGFVLGEGAAILVLEEEQHARGRGAPILARLAGYGATEDAYHVTAPAPRGRGLREAMQRALLCARLQPADVQYINAHGTATELNDKAETQAVKDLFGEHAYRVHISSTKSMIGHTLGAAGAVEASFSILAMRDGIVPPTINLSTPDPECDLNYTPNTAVRSSLSVVMSNVAAFGGHNVSLVFTPVE